MQVISTSFKKKSKKAASYTFPAKAFILFAACPIWGMSHLRRVPMKACPIWGQSLLPEKALQHGNPCFLPSFHDVLCITNWKANTQPKGAMEGLLCAGGKEDEEGDEVHLQKNKKIMSDSDICRLWLICRRCMIKLCRRLKFEPLGSIIAQYFDFNVSRVSLPHQ